MDWQLFSQLLATFCVAALGWWVAHFLSARRDLTNDRRKMRVSYLLEAYRELERASNRDDYRNFWADLESAIADVQLLGSPHQVSLARKFALDMARNRTASIDGLIADLRRSLRAELELEPTDDGVIYLRFSGESNFSAPERSSNGERLRTQA